LAGHCFFEGGGGGEGGVGVFDDSVGVEAFFGGEEEGVGGGEGAFSCGLE